jgi:hypothetical protein
MAEAICPLCGQPIGYERQFQQDHKGRLVHFACNVKRVQGIGNVKPPDLPKPATTPPKFTKAQRDAMQRFAQGHIVQGLRLRWLLPIPGDDDYTPTSDRLNKGTLEHLKRKGYVEKKVLDQHQSFDAFRNFIYAITEAGREAWKQVAYQEGIGNGTAV